MTRMSLVSCFILSSFFSLANAFAEVTATAETVTQIESTATQAETVTQSLPQTKAVATASSEEQIPVQLTAKKSTVASDNPIGRALLTLSVLGLLVGGGFYAVRKYSVKSNSKSEATQIKILTQHYLGPKKSLAIVRVAGESVLIGITDQNINMIKSLSLLDEDLPQDLPKDFNSVLGKNFIESKPSNIKTQVDKSTEKDEFSFSGIKDIVSNRLKNMRTLE